LSFHEPGKIIFAFFRLPGDLLQTEPLVKPLYAHSLFDLAELEGLTYPDPAFGQDQKNISGHEQKFE
jgi:hypothetical protein